MKLNSVKQHQKQRFHLGFVGSHTHLAGLEEVKANVGVTCGRIHTVLTEVFTDVFWGGLRQQTVYTLPKKIIIS